MVPVEYATSCATFVVHKKCFKRAPYDNTNQIAHVEYGANDNDDLIGNDL